MTLKHIQITQEGLHCTRCKTTEPLTFPIRVNAVNAITAQFKSTHKPCGIGTLPTTRKCSKCGEVKPIQQYHRAGHLRRSACCECVKKQNLHYYWLRKNAEQ